MNVFLELVYAVAGVKHYPEFLKNKKSKVCLYVALIVFLYFVLANVRLIPSAMELVAETKEAVLAVPDFQLKSGYLQMEESFYFEQDNVLIMLEPEYGSYINSVPQSDWYAMLDGCDFAVVADETTMLLKNNGEINIFDYSADVVLSRDWIYSLIDYIYVAIAVYLVFVYLFSFAGYFLAAVFVTFVAMVICSFMNQKLTFGQLYLLALYAKTLPLLVKGVLKLAEIGFFGYSVVAFAIACLYVGFAIRHMNIQEEQKKVGGPIVF